MNVRIFSVRALNARVQTIPRFFSHPKDFLGNGVRTHVNSTRNIPTTMSSMTAVTEEVFKKADISEGINVNGENLTNLRFANDVALSSKQQNKWKNT